MLSDVSGRVETLKMLRNPAIPIYNLLKTLSETTIWATLGTSVKKCINLAGAAYGRTSSLQMLLLIVLTDFQEAWHLEATRAKK